MTKAPALDERIVALMLIAGAFQTARQPLGYDHEAVFGVRVRDLYRDGVRGTGTLAFRALEKEGFSPRWAGQGNIRTIALS